jgi:OmpA-OmpF porin, OOP family
MRFFKQVVIAALLLLVSNLFSQDTEGCKDNPMFPTRMPNYTLSECRNNFDAIDFPIGEDDAKVSKEGTKSFSRYDFNDASGQPKPSCLQILRNYENAAKKLGATTVWLNKDAARATFKIMKNGKEATWIKIESGGNENTDFYELTVIQLEEMKQEVTSNDILSALNTDGRISLYINFETGKSDIKPESQKVIDEISGMLKENPSLKISIEGHTDNAGTPASNKTLSVNRAKAVMNAVAAKGIDRSRMASRGWGQDKPVDNNSSEEGKAKNRRVEIVKL